jgi:two-component system, LytTR family, response regulator LytT
MKIVIIEDEKLTADDLADTILKVEPESDISAILRSVREAVSYFQSNKQPDLIFCDIQLGDGLSFEIFREVTLSVPVIFCTAYDEYALNAFKANGINYILKPFTKKVIREAFSRYKELRHSFYPNIPEYEQITALLESRLSSESQSILVYFKDKIIPINISDIAVFYLENRITYLITFNKQTFMVNYSLEELEKKTGKCFYRASRKFLVNRKAITDVAQWFKRKLVINLSVPLTINEKITVSKEKTTHFLSWLSGK